MQVGLGRQLKEAKAIIAEENTDAPIDCSPLCGQEPPRGISQRLFLLLL